MDDTHRRQARSAIRQIHDILWNDWDPIGVCGAGPEDEYDGYIAEVMRLLQSGAPRQAMVDHLADCESDSMGLPPADRDRLVVVTDKLLALDLSKEES